jgi:hypothetical protein
LPQRTQKDAKRPVAAPTTEPTPSRAPFFEFFSILAATSLRGLADLPFLVPSLPDSGSKAAKPRSRQRGQAQAVRREGKIKPVSRRDPCWLRQLRRFWLARRRRTEAGIAAKNTEGRKKVGSSANDRANAKLGPLFLSSFRFLRLPLSGAWRIFLSSSLHGQAAEAKSRSREAAKGDRRRQYDAKGRSSLWPGGIHVGFGS